MKHTTQKYPASMVLMHTVVAVLMLTTLVLGWMMEDDQSLIPLHKSFGVLVLVFGVLRLLNRLGVKKGIPESVNAKGSIQYIIEKSTHGFLYLLMVGMPIGGWLTSNAYGYPVSVFGWFELPTLVSKNMDLAKLIGGMHELGANVFVALLILHLAGGIAHLVKSKQNVFKRMMF